MRDLLARALRASGVGHAYMTAIGGDICIACGIVGSYEHSAEYQADAILSTPEGKAIAAVVEAAVTWHAIYGKRFQPDFDYSDYRADADASLDIMRAVNAYLALAEAQP